MDTHTDQYLAEADVVGSHVMRVCYLDLPLNQGFQERRVLVELSNGLSFALDTHLEWFEGDRSPRIRVALPDSKMYEVFKPSENIQLRSPIVAMIECDWFDHQFGLLFENGAALTGGVSEFENFALFYDNVDLRRCFPCGTDRWRDAVRAQIANATGQMSRKMVSVNES